MVGTKSSRSAKFAPTWAQELGAEVRRRRKALRLTQRELADLSSCGSDFLYDLERGKPTVRLDKLLSVLEILGLKLKLEARADRFTTAQGEWMASAPNTR